MSAAVVTDEARMNAKRLGDHWKESFPFTDRVPGCSAQMDSTPGRSSKVHGRLPTQRNKRMHGMEYRLVSHDDGQSHVAWNLCYTGAEIMSVDRVMPTEGSDCNKEGCEYVLPAGRKNPQEHVYGDREG